MRSATDLKNAMESCALSCQCKSNDAQTWTKIYQSDDGNEQLTEFDLGDAVEADYFRILITGSDRDDREVAIREVLIE